VTPGAAAFNRGIDAFNAKDYATAAAAFNEFLAINPRAREALYNLASTYYAMSNSDSLIVVGERLVALDPLNDNNLRLVAGGYQMKKNQDQMIKYAMLITELPVNIEVSGFQTGAAAATWTGSATGRGARNQSDQPIAPAPMTLVFEFLDQAGNVVATQEVAVRALPEVPAGPVRPELRSAVSSFISLVDWGGVAAGLILSRLLAFRVALPFLDLCLGGGHQGLFQLPGAPEVEDDRIDHQLHDA
jgi:tetratricopeptide (TPR) repeat protein